MPELEDFIPTVEEVEEMRKERGINRQSMDAALDMSSGSWSHAINQQALSKEARLKALIVFRFVDKRGYIPEPIEVR